MPWQILVVLSVCVLIDSSIVWEYVEESIGTAYEVWMIRVYVSILYLNELNDHVCCRSEALIKHLLHYIADFVLQSLESIDLTQIDSSNYISQLLVNLVSTV